MNDVQHLSLASLDLDELLLKRKGLKRVFSKRDHLQPVRIAVLGGSTSVEVVNILELWLLDSGFQPVFYQSEYGKYYTDAVFESHTLLDFKPDVVYIHTSIFNIERFPPLRATAADVTEYCQAELQRFQEIWSAIDRNLGCLVIQNNFEFPPLAILGNLDAVANGQTRFVTELNREFALAAATSPMLFVQDVCSIAARVGLNHWFDAKRWFSYKIVTSAEGSNALAISLASMLRAMFGKTRKVLVLDLDNTLWGGTIGDDGVDKIQIGRETPLAEAYTAFQQYCLSLRERGILLAVCSKNDDQVARQGFEHPDSVLKLEHLSCFKANWSPKHENIEAIARELDLGVDSFVFVDDNPAERAIVIAQLGSVAVPDIGDDVTRYAAIIESGRYFEQITVSQEDLKRASLYQRTAERVRCEATFADYGEYLQSLEMGAEIEAFRPVYLDRLAQLTNKTNQFNLTTRRLTLAEVTRISTDPTFITLFAKLSDRYGDHGLISVVIGRKEGTTLHIDLWLMSCRVLKRNVELAVLDVLALRAREAGLSQLVGYYLPTSKNIMVADFYPRMGFIPYSLPTIDPPENTTIWKLELSGFTPKNQHIRLEETNNV